LAANHHSFANLMTTLVTGATGFVGNNVVRLLVERGAHVRVLARESADERPLAGLKLEIVRGDVRDRSAVERALEGISHLIHAAGLVHIGWKRRDEQQAVNVEGTCNVASAARRAGARMVYVSSIDSLAAHSPDGPSNESTPINGEICCPYVTTKREAERAVLDDIACGLDAVIVNPGFMLGPWDWKPSSGKMLLKVAAGWGLLAPPGGNSYCDVRDVATGIVSALDRGRTGQRYILAGQTLTYREALTILARITGGRRPIRTVRRWAVKTVGVVGDLHAWVTGRESDVNSAAAAMSLWPKDFTSARAAAELGYHSRGIEESAADAWQWLKEHGYAKS
jgi:dihydroflavonol-4-reductase